MTDFLTKKLEKQHIFLTFSKISPLFLTPNGVSALTFIQCFDTIGSMAGRAGWLVSF